MNNPMFRDSILKEYSGTIDTPMSVSGTVGKLLLLMLIFLTSAAAVFYQFLLQKFDYVNMLTIAGLIISFILSMIIAFKPKTSPYLSPVYAFAEGALLSGISCFFETMFPGIVVQAVSITFAVMFVMAVLYLTGIIKATERFRAAILSATFAIFIFYLIGFILMLFNINIPYFSNSYSIGFVILNIAIAIIAALNFIIDFDFIEKGSRSMLPSYYEWYGAVSLIITLAWLYIEILKLLSRLRNR